MFKLKFQSITILVRTFFGRINFLVRTFFGRINCLVRTFFGRMNFLVGKKFGLEKNCWPDTIISRNSFWLEQISVSSISVCGNQSIFEVSKIISDDSKVFQPMWVFDPGSAQTRPSAWTPIDVSRNFAAHISAEYPSNISSHI